MYRFLLAFMICSPLFAESAKPNIILIMVDDMGWAGVSCYDNKYFKTPGIDRMANEGIKLTDFHSNGVVCSPTRAALMTGRYQQRSGCDVVINADPKHADHVRGISDEEWTFPEAMKSAGYATAMFGKWHLGYKPEFHPMNHGFDEFAGFISGNIDAQSHYDRMETFDWWQNRELKDEPGHHSDLITEHALDFIERKKDQPFFLYVAHGTPHSPFQARGSKIQRGPDKGTIPAWAPKVEYTKEAGDDNWLIRHFTLPVDEGVNRILDKLIELKIEKNTIVWFLSDNGAAKGNFSHSENTRGAKGSMYEGGHRVPALVWAPGRIKAGTISDQTLMTYDIMASTIIAAQVQLPNGHQLDGINIHPSLFNNKKLEKRTLLWENGKGSGALRKDNYKLVVNKKSRELYDLKTDSKETTNLAKESPEITQEMYKEYLTILTEIKKDAPYSK
ncbi:sulfatase-like hydrolase/transferase [Lentisphaera profundi]|uniref:Sulfatase-like hydrolase/transferase n=1 Tax=Lentisphaera profundi TaxID=1658616 RepID=A0ABY7VZ97_9BACT|nr:sulfatase-like hydrolase/transferase [Lentisphaera profundi]WDE99256.1 sulfatase-like hydrolase/transferase [Lentisphaera profundi]